MGGFAASIMPLTSFISYNLFSAQQNISPPILTTPSFASSTQTYQGSPVSASLSKKRVAQPHAINPQTAKTSSQTDVIAKTAQGSSEEQASYPPTVDISHVKAAVVNIICISSDPNLSSMTASGVIIDSRGIILTNAHVGQYFLLSNYVEKGLLHCEVRGGNPAKNLYSAELLYIPTHWIESNATVFSKNSSKGTGEDDFALLRIKETADGNSLSAKLPFLPYTTTAQLHKNDTLVAAAYPAEFIPTSDIAANLYDLSIATKIEELLTFKSSTVDLFRMNGSIIAQKGSSGGAVVDAEGMLVGIIATASGAFIDNERNLYAITIPYINSELEKFNGVGLDELLTGNISRKAIDFSLYTAPMLLTLLEANSAPNQ